MPVAYDRFGDVGREEGERQEPTDVGPMHAVAPGDIGDASILAVRQRFQIKMGARKDRDERPVGLSKSGVSIRQDQAVAIGATLQRGRDIDRNERILRWVLVLLGMCPPATHHVRICVCVFEKQPPHQPVRVHVETDAVASNRDAMEHGAQHSLAPILLLTRP